MKSTHALQISSIPVKRAFSRIRHPYFIHRFDSNIAPNDVEYLFINFTIWASVADSNRDYLWSQLPRD